MQPIRLGPGACGRGPKAAPPPRKGVLGSRRVRARGEEQTFKRDGEGGVRDARGRLGRGRSSRRGPASRRAPGRRCATPQPIRTAP